MNTSKNLAKHTYELAINILVTFIIYSEIYIQYVVAFIMTFIAFLLFSAKTPFFKATCMHHSSYFLCFFFLCKRILYNRHLKCHITHLLLAQLYFIIAKNQYLSANKRFILKRYPWQAAVNKIDSNSFLATIQGICLSYVILSTSLALFQNSGALRTNRFASVSKRYISSCEIVKSNVRFCFIRSKELDFGNGITPFCKANRRQICAGKT